jgi:hypothetical protein
MTYVLNLYANNGETAKLIFYDLSWAIAMRESFMLTGDYRDAVVEETQ